MGSTKEVNQLTLQDVSGIVNSNQLLFRQIIAEHNADLAKLKSSLNTELAQLKSFVNKEFERRKAEIAYLQNRVRILEAQTHSEMRGDHY